MVLRQRGRPGRTDADWSEYFGHQPADGSGDVYFHLDPLWSSPAIDAVAIDCYWPLSDWRDDALHLDRLGPAEWSLRRTPITDGAGKPWVFRFKDLRSWWSNAQFDRPGGIESAMATARVPQSKPVWFTEIGCPAVDKGANQPNVFVDPKSSESFFPYHSRGHRDDLIQRRYLQAILEAFDPGHPGALAGANPTSSVYGAPMLDLSHVHVYAWDARPYPAFPNDLDTWGDGENWRLGHWINGRVASQPLSAVVGALLDDYDFSAHDATSLDGMVGGYVIDRSMSAREALQPLELAYFFDTRESGGIVRFGHRGAALPVAALTADDLVETKAGAEIIRLTRGQETELPAAARITYASTESDYRQAVAQSRRLVGASGRISDAELALVMSADRAAAVADTWLHEAWATRERAIFTLPPSRLALEPGDMLSLVIGNRPQMLRLIEIGDHGAREVQARSIDPDIYIGSTTPERPSAVGAGVISGTATAIFLDLPLLTGNEDPSHGYVAAAKVPWPGGIAIYRSPEDSGFTLTLVAGQPATIGSTLDVLPSGPEGRLDTANRFRVRIASGQLASVTPLALLAGGNAIAIEAPDGAWEVLQFETAVLVAPETYELSRLLRGQAGTEAAMSVPKPVGSRVVLIDQAVRPVPLAADEIGLSYAWRFGPASRDIADSTYASATHAFLGLGHRPLSPVHVRGTRSGGDLTIQWVRRTRSGGDSWTAVEVPLAEDAERYEIDILDGATLVRTLSSTTASVVYTAGDQLADFGTLPPSVQVRVAQVSATFGRGSARDAVI